MATIKPFCAIRPTRDKAALVASRSYISYSKESLDDKLSTNPYTFLHIINPSTANDDSTSHHFDKFNLIKSKFNDFLEEGILQKDQQKQFYIYQKIKANGLIFNGIVGAASVDDYLNQRIKRHEQTIEKREKLFKDYLKMTGFNAEPVLLTYPNHTAIDAIIESYTNQRAEYEFTTTDQDTHKLWLVHDKMTIQQISDSFSEIDHLYIADGHHRFASSALLYQEHDTLTNNNAYCMSYLVGENQIQCLNFNRLVKDLNTMSSQDFISKVSERFTVQPVETVYQPQEKDELSMYCDGQWYSLIVKEKYVNRHDSVEKLDPSILNYTILHPILNIVNPRTDKRISYVEGNVPLEHLQSKIDLKEFAVAFVLKPISIQQIMEVANDNKTMPPKSTYIQPKLRSGMLIYDLDQ